MATNVYSFLDVVGTIDGPGGSFDLLGAGVAEEGITFAFADDKNTMVVGAGGDGQHNLHAGKQGTVTLRLLKTSPLNGRLQAMYDFQTTFSANHGQNNIVVRNVARGDIVSARQAAFKKFPDVTDSKDGPMLEWTFDAIYLDPKLGYGLPAIA